MVWSAQVPAAIAATGVNAIATTTTVAIRRESRTLLKTIILTPP